VDLGEEGLVGLITYMRTDSTRGVSGCCSGSPRIYRQGVRTAGTCLKRRTYKEKKEAQAAHEAIRPTSAMRHPDQIKPYLKEDEFKVYKLIWQTLCGFANHARRFRSDYGGY